MTEPNHPLNTLHDIKDMMERSSRFISLSGLSGISAGICALVGAWFANGVIHTSHADISDINPEYYIAGASHAGRAGLTIGDLINDSLFRIGITTFVAAFILAFMFTYIRSHKKGVPLWGKTSRRLFINVSVPIAVGGLYILKVMSTGGYGLIAPGCLIFYGLALVNAAKYTLSEIRYLGYCELLLGLLNLLYVGYGLYFWALGFGVLHIIYGAAMWWRYERGGADT
ncbi:MAG TPA: hypothetical protein VG738_18200 [Chitinophagaceae bacterium]|nr:hypothetical protein [Chitinophagaceae bacterium]